MVLALAAAAESPVPADAEIRKILTERVETYRQSAGIVVGVVEPSGHRMVSAGVIDKSDTRTMDGDTVFEIGSITKVFTALLLTDMVERGEVKLDDPITKYLPAEVKVPQHGDRPITLADLATHTSGLPRIPGNLTAKDPANPYADYTAARLYDFLASYKPVRDPGAQWEYSNLGTGLLGHILALRAGVDFETLVRTRITQPLKMQNTGIALSPTMKARMAVGHNVSLAVVPAWDFQVLAGAGALRSTANDMDSFLDATLGYTKTPLAKAMAAMLAVRRPIKAPDAEQALGWHIIHRAGRELVWKDGGTYGFGTFIGFDPQAKVGVAVLANAFVIGDGQASVDDIGLHLLDAAFPLTAPAKDK